MWCSIHKWTLSNYYFPNHTIQQPESYLAVTVTNKKNKRNLKNECKSFHNIKKIQSHHSQFEMLLHSEAKSICGSIITWCKSQPCTLKKKIKVQWSFPKTGYFTATICESLKQQYFLAYSCQWLRNGGQKVPAHPSVEPQWSCNLQLCTCCTAGQNVTMQRRCHQKYIHVLMRATQQLESCIFLTI